MAETTGISWADATFNPVIGCTKVSPACDRCYAARDNMLRKWVGDGEWGPGHRRRTKTWGDPVKWNRKAALAGVAGPRVFCASLADVFDNEWLPEWRTDLWALIRATQSLRWMLVTKRIGNARKMLPADWTSGAFDHVGLIATLESQEVWDRDINKLMGTPAAWHGVSIEPMLGQIYLGYSRPDWVITGGESGPGHRPLDMAWVRSMRDQCAAAGIAYHHKQNGGYRGKDAGCLIDDVEHKHFPAALAA